MASLDKLTVSIELSPEFKSEVQALAERIAHNLAAEYAQAFDARIRAIVFEAMRQREVRLLKAVGGHQKSRGFRLQTRGPRPFSPRPKSEPKVEAIPKG